VGAKTYRSRPLTLISYGAMVLAYTVFLGSFILKGGFAPYYLLLGALVLPVGAFFLFLLFKKVEISQEGISVLGLTGKKFIRWDEIVSVSLAPGRKYFLILESKDSLAVIDDSVGKFKEILQEVGKRVSREKLPENYSTLASSYKPSYWYEVAILVSALILLFVVIQRGF
jgi:hypothetical protein